MNFLTTIIISCFIGTTLMTSFSYLLSYVFNNQFKEPVLLQKLLQRSAWFKGKNNNHTAGWVLHYLAGLGWVIIYYILFNYSVVNPTFLSGILLGLASGILGIGVWWIIFRIHQNPPSVNLKAYFIHLIAVHIIFGLGATTCYYFLEG